MPVKLVGSFAVMMAALGCGGGGPAGDADRGVSGLPEPPLAPGPTKPTGTVEERVSAAKRLHDEKDLTGAIAKLEEGLMIAPEDRTTLGLVVSYMRERAKEVSDAKTPEHYTLLVSAAEYLRRLRRTYPELTPEEKELSLDMFYDEATVLARSVRIEEATVALRDLAAAGFTDFERVRQDPHWRQILAVPEFKKTFDEVAASKKDR